MMRLCQHCCLYSTVLHAPEAWKLRYFADQVVDGAFRDAHYRISQSLILALWTECLLKKADSSRAQRARYFLCATVLTIEIQSAKLGSIPLLEFIGDNA